jgi:hypothetical protein
MRQYASTQTVCTLDTQSYATTVRCMGAHTFVYILLCNVKPTTRDHSLPTRGGVTLRAGAAPHADLNTVSFTRIYGAVHHTSTYESATAIETT